MRLWNAITGKRHWYTVKLQYHKDAKRLFSATRTIGVAHRGEILHERDMRKLVASTIDFHKVHHLLCNGEFTVEVVAYLGKFRKPDKSAAVTVDAASIIFNLLMDR